MLSYSCCAQLKFHSTLEQFRWELEKVCVFVANLHIETKYSIKNIAFKRNIFFVCARWESSPIYSLLISLNDFPACSQFLFRIQKRNIENLKNIVSHCKYAKNLTISSFFRLSLPFPTFFLSFFCILFNITYKMRIFFSIHSFRFVSFRFISVQSVIKYGVV